MRRTGADRYTVRMTQEEGVWLIEAVDLVGVRSFGRTVSAAVGNIREAIAAAEDLDVWDELSFDFLLRSDVATAALHRFRAADRAKEEAVAKRAMLLRAAVDALQSTGMSYRDTAAVIGISHQRVAQLAAGDQVDIRPTSTG